MIQTSTGLGWLGSKAVELGLLLAAIVALSLMASKPAYATTFTVNSTGDTRDDTPDGVCDSDPRPFFIRCTLREAIDEANHNGNAAQTDLIKFSISGDGPHTIEPSSVLPIFQPVIIDGYTEGDATSRTSDDARENTLATGATNAVLKVELSGINTPDSTVLCGLDIDAPTTVRGLVINRFDRRAGICINSGAGGSRIEGNFIGTNAAGTADLGNSRAGVDISDVEDNTIGGTAAAARNIISGNGGDGVLIDDADNVVAGNLIGTKKDGATALGNGGDGVSIDSGDALIDRGAHNNTIGGISSSAANTIAFNGREGVEVIGNASLGNRILNNSIFSNVGLGIDLAGGIESASGATANDPGDTDTGPNNLQNKPVLSSAVISGGVTTIQGNLNSTPKSTFVIQFFSNPSGNEGKKFIGQKSVSTNSNGDVAFSFSPAVAVREGQTITATATGAEGTSEYSSLVLVEAKALRPSCEGESR